MLDVETTRQILERYARGETQTAIAARVGRSQSQVSRILARMGLRRPTREPCQRCARRRRARREQRLLRLSPIQRRYLTTDQQLLLLRLVADGWSQSEAAQFFGVSQGTVSRLLARLRETSRAVDEMGAYRYLMRGQGVYRPLNVAANTNNIRGIP